MGKARFLLLFCIVLILNSALFAQISWITGYIKDAKNGEKLPGVNVVVDSTSGGTTDTEGHYFLKLDPGSHQISYRYIGYRTVNKKISLVRGDTLKLDIDLVQETVELDLAVVSAGKFEQRLSDVTVSMEVIQPKFIENTNTTNLETAINQMPGVEVLDGQTSIRGGSGYSYGAGSRVLVLVDDLPMLTADVNEVKWNFLPVENIERIEILKGASSALYGSSALNGVINILTAWPGEKPRASATLYSGMYFKPKRKELAWWWKGNPVFEGARLSAMKKAGNVDLVGGADLFNDPGYRQDDYEKRARIDFKIRHHPEKIRDLTYGLSTNIQWQDNSDFLIWQNADSGAFMQRPGVVSPSKGFRFNIDPKITYYDRWSNRHRLQARYYSVYNHFTQNPDKNNGSNLYYAEYQFHRTFLKTLNVTAGAVRSWGVTNANLYGDHTNSNMAVFAQIDHQYHERLSTSLGVRWEQYSIDNIDKESSPVVRAGLNYQVANFTFIRASFGQGYRYPSTAEKYTATSLGSLNIFPNPDLSSEKGWSSEIGIKQGLKISNWKGYIDLAAFWTEYRNMIEFTFGVWTPDSTQKPTLDDVGFKSLNIGRARINGIDMGITGSGIIGNVPITMFAGYTYMNPLDLSTDTLQNNILKYRYRHAVKGDIGAGFGRWGMGFSFIYNSFMERIDAAFEDAFLGQEIFPGLKEYRELHNNGNFIFDLRISYRMNRYVKIALIGKNIFNKEYMGRPGDIRPPRNITIQVKVGI